MRSVQLSDNLPDKSSQGGARSEEAAINGEIAVRIRELCDEKGDEKAITEIFNWMNQYKHEPRAFMIRAQILGRIAEIAQLVGPEHAVALLQKLVAVWQVENAAFWIVIRLLTGDLSEVTLSYSQQGKEKARSKQAVQQEMERAIVAIKRHYPALAEQIIQIRSVSAKLQDEQGTAKEGA